LLGSVGSPAPPRSSRALARHDYGLDVHVSDTPKFEGFVLTVRAGFGNTSTWLPRLGDVAQRYFFRADSADAYVALGAAF